MDTEQLITQQIEKIQGIRQPTRADVIETLLLLSDQTQDFRRFHMSNYYNATCTDPDKALADLESYKEFLAEEA